MYSKYRYIYIHKRTPSSLLHSSCDSADGRAIGLVLPILPTRLISRIRLPFLTRTRTLVFDIIR
jgi:hypothetical protein